MPVFGSVSAISTEFIFSMPVCGSVNAISTEFIEYACVWLNECHFH